MKPMVIVGGLVIGVIILALCNTQDKYDKKALGGGFAWGWFVGLMSMILASPGP